MLNFAPAAGSYEAVTNKKKGHGMPQLIFVIEDDDDTRNLMKIILEMEQPEDKVAVFSTFEEALEASDVEKPCVIIMDYFISGSKMAPSEFIQRAKERFGCQFLLISGAAHLAKKAADVGVEHFLQKPFDYDEMMRRIVKLKNPAINGV